MRLIDADVAIDEITEYGSGNTIYMSVVELKRRIEQLPSAQPEHEYTMEEFMYGQDMGNPEDGSL